MQELLKNWTDALLGWMGLASAVESGLDRWVACTLVVLVVAAFDWLCRLVVVQGVHRVVERTAVKWDDELFSRRVLTQGCHVVSAIVLSIVLPVAFEEASGGRTFVVRLSECLIVVAVCRLVNALLVAVFRIVARRPAWQDKPIKGLRQTGQGICLFIGAILIVSFLVGKSPTILLTGLGASAAIVLLVFRDSILGFVSGIQLSANDMLKVGDWIQMPKYGANGTVIEVTLTTVKIRNFDNTIVTLPPYVLVSDSFQNWQAMKHSGGRRVMRSVPIDMTSVRFCTPEMLARYRRIDLVRDYIDQTTATIELYDEEHGAQAGASAETGPGASAGSRVQAGAVSGAGPAVQVGAAALSGSGAAVPGSGATGAGPAAAAVSAESASELYGHVNGEHRTNLGIFRVYMMRYLEQRVAVNHDMRMTVRTLEPTAAGIPLQLYFYTVTVDWREYEQIQSEVFEHLLASLEAFDLQVFQNPTGWAVESLRGVVRAAGASEEA